MWTDGADVKRIKVEADAPPVAAQEEPPPEPYTPDPHEPVYITEALEGTYRNRTCCYSLCQHPITQTIDPNSFCYSCHRPVHTLADTGPCQQCHGGLLCSSVAVCCDLHSFTMCHGCWFSEDVDLALLMDMFRAHLDSAGVDGHHPNWVHVDSQEATMIAP
jgi:hypothetical protein